MEGAGCGGVEMIPDLLQETQLIEARYRPLKLLGSGANGEVLLVNDQLFDSIGFVEAHRLSK